MKASLKETICHILQRLGLISDWVVEQGTSGIWTYRKWNSGIAECWGEQSKLVGWNAWGAVWESNQTYGASYPTNLFISRPTLIITTQATASTGTIGVEPYEHASATSTGEIYALRPTSAGTTTVRLGFHAVGLWKTFVGGGTA